MTCCEPAVPVSARAYRAHIRHGTTPCDQSRRDKNAYDASLPPRPPRSQAPPRPVADPDDYSDPQSDVREAQRERVAAVQWLEDTFTAEEAAMYLRRLSTS